TNGFATSMIDISDGLLQDANHIAESSKTDLVLNLDDIPIEAQALEYGLLALEACSGGDDYELLFTAKPAKRAELENMHLTHKKQIIPCVTRIGLCRVTEFTHKPRVWMRNISGETISANQLVETLSIPLGYTHF